MPANSRSILPEDLIFHIHKCQSFPGFAVWCYLAVTVCPLCPADVELVNCDSFYALRHLPLDGSDSFYALGI